MRARKADPGRAKKVIFRQKQKKIRHGHGHRGTGNKSKKSLYLLAIMSKMIKFADVLALKGYT